MMKSYTCLRLLIRIREPHIHLNPFGLKNKKFRSLLCFPLNISDLPVDMALYSVTSNQLEWILAKAYSYMHIFFGK